MEIETVCLDPEENITCSAFFNLNFFIPFLSSFFFFCWNSFGFRKNLYKKMMLGSVNSALRLLHWKKCQILTFYKKKKEFLITVILYQVSKPYHTARVSFSLILKKIDWSKKVKVLLLFSEQDHILAHLAIPGGLTCLQCGLNFTSRNMFSLHMTSEHKSFKRW